MSVKRLGAGSGNKLAAITAAVSDNLEEVTRQLERPVDRTRGVFERVSLESVRPDPDNPRNLKLSWEELKKGIADLEAGRIEAGERTTRTRNLESIASKADSFKKVGQMQPIIVYRDDRGLLRIVDGEMRYWAARLCGWTELDAKVRAKKPTYLRLEQYAANVLRDDLNLGQQLNNLELMLDEARESGESVKSLSELASLMNRPRTTVQQWWAILREANEDVKAAIREDQITSLDAAYTAAQEPDAGRRAALLSGHALPARGASVKAGRRGRKLSGVQLGKAKDLEIVRQLIETVGGDVSLGEVDWADAKSVQLAWQKFMKAFTERVKRQKATRSI
ncbi:MAG: ParB N-terminal domain-containing protein [Rhodomicrobium sp.]